MKSRNFVKNLIRQLAVIIKSVRHNDIGIINYCSHLLTSTESTDVCGIQKIQTANKKTKKLCVLQIKLTV